MKRTHLTDGLLERGGSVLLEGVGLSGSSSISEVDSEVLDGVGLLLGDSLDLDDFSGGSLELVEGGVDLPTLLGTYRGAILTRTGIWRRARSYRRL